MLSGRGAYVALQLAVLAVLGRLLTPTDYGLLSAAMVVVGFSEIVSQLGVGPALIQRLELEDRHIDTAFVSAVGLCLLLGAGIWLIAPAAAVFFHSQDLTEVIRALAWVFPISGIGTVAESLARRQLRFRLLARLDVISYAVGYGLVAIPLAFAGKGVWALVVGEITKSALRSGILLVDRPPRLRWLAEWRAFRELMYFGGGFTVGKMAYFFAMRGDNLMVGYLLGPAPLGLYSRAYQLMSGPAAALGMVLDQVLFPVMAKVQASPRRLELAYRRAVALVAALALPLSAVVFVLAPEIVRVILGPRWGDVVFPFRVLAVAMLFQTSTRISDSLARATGAVYRRAWRQIIFALLVVGGAWAGHGWGIPGVACGVLAAILINYAMMTQLCLDVAEMSWSALARAHVPALVLTALAAPVAWLVAVALRAQGLPAILVLGGALLATAGWTAWLARRHPRVLGSDLLWMLEALAARLPARFRRRLSLDRLALARMRAAGKPG